MEALSIDLARHNEAAQISRVLGDATIRKVTYGDMSWGSEGWSEDDSSELISRSPTYAVRLDGEIVGTVGLQWEDASIWGDQPPVAGYIHRLAIKDGFHGLGLGEQVLNWAQAEAAKKGRSLLRLDCSTDNPKLCAYYEKLGFVQVGTKHREGDGVSPTALYERST